MNSWKVQFAVSNRAPHPNFALCHRLVGQAHKVKLGRARRAKIDFDDDRHRIDADQRCGVDLRDH
ncbi:MAG: hypothetical protein UZ18_ATM001002505 [Armatimonadetes bacterium OLB18]|nr:MAG: hypothetical protein UZ18_ATM001002505 [Armatimonadetes bacterium OLB18]